MALRRWSFETGELSASLTAGFYTAETFPTGFAILNAAPAVQCFQISDSASQANRGRSKVSKYEAQLGKPSRTAKEDRRQMLAHVVVGELIVGDSYIDNINVVSFSLRLRAARNIRSRSGSICHRHLEPSEAEAVLTRLSSAIREKTAENDSKENLSLRGFPSHPSPWSLVYPDTQNHDLLRTCSSFKMTAAGTCSSTLQYSHLRNFTTPLSTS
ncbi:hypothetical protein IW261DRAFT_552759 [Armillaria novae-zelandiae]|uniref:Uncharacterized protein n=1 Tax=Armillaria novae-zelandiae TaxID=153914 RepID=A0AA39NZ58_9AGAR|nr:hypothetical protein IW261DRAFT_552759 [Armillaria novae-zelandiae]